MLEQLHHALESRGFFYCANVDALMDEAYIASVYEYAKRAHALPADVKRLHNQSKQTRDMLRAMRE